MGISDSKEMALCRLILRISFMLVLADLAAGAEVTPLDTDFITGDLGESDGIGSDEMLGEAQAEFLEKEGGDYAGTKKKLEDEIKKIRDGLKKKKDAAKKDYHAQMKKYSKDFAKLYQPIEGKHKEALDSPLGSNGMQGMSDMARWAYSRQISTWSQMAHKKIEALEIKLEENRYQHFSTAVCAEVLKSGVHAIGDMQYQSKKKKILEEMAAQKAGLKRKMSFDKADMSHKLASYQLWSQDSTTAAMGGFMGNEDPKAPRMMSDGSVSKTAASQLGELTQAAHWAYAQQRTHNYEVFDHQMKLLKKKLENLRTQHDLTLCRTGRKPESPELKYRLSQAKNKLKQEIAKLPEAGDEAKDGANKGQEKKEAAKAEKKEEAKKEEAKKEEATQLGESATEEDPHLKNQLIFEFHKLIDASGGHETLDERAKMWRNMVADERAKEQTLRQQLGLKH